MSLMQAGLRSPEDLKCPFVNFKMGLIDFEIFCRILL
jgi:hypothetical protein